jgi:hypothetical protein
MPKGGRKTNMIDVKARGQVVRYGGITPYGWDTLSRKQQAIAQRCPLMCLPD